MAVMMRRIRFENKGQSYQMRCAYCKRPKKELYQVKFDENSPSYMVCPGNCLRQSYNNYEQNKNKVIQADGPTETDTILGILRESTDDNIDR